MSIVIKAYVRQPHFFVIVDIVGSHGALVDEMVDLWLGLHQQFLCRNISVFAMYSLGMGHN